MIKTDRLTLRPPVMEDAAAVTAALQDFDVARWLTSPPYPYTLADAKSYIARDHGGLVFFMEDADGICGCISLADGLGYWLAQDRWGRGYMTEAATAVVDHHFATTNDDLSSGHVIGNVASRAILVRLGFRDHLIKEIAVPALNAKADVQKMILPRAGWDALT